MGAALQLQVVAVEVGVGLEVVSFIRIKVLTVLILNSQVLSIRHRICHLGYLRRKLVWVCGLSPERWKTLYE